jgi:hypothetical protein
MNRVVFVSMALTLLAPVMFFLVERRVLARDRVAATPLAAVPVPVSPGGGAPRA